MFHRLRLFFFRSTCSTTGSLFRFLVPFLEHAFQATRLYCLCWFLLEHVFSYWNPLPFSAAFFRAGVPRQQICTVFACFCLEACTVLAIFVRASVPRLHVRIVFNWLARHVTRGILPTYRKALTNFITCFIELI